MRLLREVRGYSILFVVMFLVMLPFAACSHEIKQQNDIEMTHNGHRYLLLSDPAAAKSNTIVHDPDCPKCLARNR